ncbi:hypothetical protein [Rubneribacter sp.]
MADQGSGVRRMGKNWGNAVLAAVCFALFAAGAAFLVSAIVLSGCTPAAVVDEGSPRFERAGISAGSDLTESSQYVEARLAFDAPLEAAADVASDLSVLVNGQKPDARTIEVEARAEGSEVVVRLVPTAAADGSQPSVYYALYDGLVSVSAASADGALPHVRAEGGGSNAVLAEAVSFTVPTGVRVGGIQAAAADAAAGAGASVSFDVEQFAQLRCCTWFWFGEGLPLVMMHNHEFSRDLPETCAQRLADTVNAVYGDSLEADCDDARVTVRAPGAADGTELAVRVVEGAGADPGAGVTGFADAAAKGASEDGDSAASPAAEGGDAA